ncbi:hypothetical protein E1264_17815 [Actinomadura sp. KC216]|uniref:hypothetical protein n=1 Tax=Actinomadura sp. KC216 TaxID=2530370 RepID=UPI00104F0D49|nr:hypothetical protein [Actinomadura sp. KC216]TDB86456.1 hypothetical protein E1264_17815 [Actinomadura sp. KC216]
MKIEDFPPNEQRALALAKVALTAYMAGAHQTAVETIKQIETETAAVDLALLAWCDWMAQALGVSGYRGPVKLLFGGMGESGSIERITGAEAVDRPEIVWAGQLIVARIAQDKDIYGALMLALPHDPAAVGRHVLAVLEIAALSMRGTLTEHQLATLVRTCHRDGLIGDEAAVTTLAESAGIDRGRAAALLLAATAPERHDDGSWTP